MKFCQNSYSKGSNRQGGLGNKQGVWNLPKYLINGGGGGDKWVGWNFSKYLINEKEKRIGWNLNNLAKIMSV